MVLWIGMITRNNLAIGNLLIGTIEIELFKYTQTYNLNLNNLKNIQNSSFSVPVCSSHFPESSDIKFTNFASIKL
jgi:hypothetical protein